MKRASLIAIICLSNVLAQMPPILLHDFSKQLPQALGSEKPQKKVIMIALGSPAEPILKVSLQTLGTAYIKSVGIELDGNPGDHTVSAELGNPINSGTQTSPVMQVPLKVTWAKSGPTGWKSRTDLYILSPLVCKKQTD
ncbi:MAG: hypothetical protein KIS61_00175 [Candidatus Eremiobacteraeota bacterium]|nr:hypothetical protein [Candidatus Eremiobacteraeota bacterium]